jgi:hypothetical protein
MNNAPLSKKDLTELYRKGRSMKQIAGIFSCSLHKVVYWMNKYQLLRRTLSQAIYLSANPRGDPFKIKTSLNKKETFLFGLGLGIYWGEGEKISKGQVRVTNTNPAIIKTFIRFLMNICRLEKRKLLFQIICFNDSDPVQVRKYWAEELKIKEEKFGKIIQIPKQGKGTYKKKSVNGVCVLTISSIKLKPWIMGELEKLQISLDGSVEERILGKN